MDNRNIPTKLGTAILLVIAITVGAFVWVYEKEQGSIVADISIQSLQKKIQTDTVKDPQETLPFPEMDQAEKNRLTELTKDWQTYRDEKYGYEFKYPQEYSIEKNKYEPDISEVSVISNNDCVLPFDSRCNITIRILSSDDERVKDLESDTRDYTTRFYKNDHRTTYRLSDGLSALIQTSKNTYFIVSLPYPESILPIFQGILFTFSELSAK